ncbi:hypothetical protein B0H19DRAFT_1059406 [Mycena capillaripes]|nr:hypothetical protein B0H19DRAFT_1059406 [Mycena capillaripes]
MHNKIHLDPMNQDLALANKKRREARVYSEQGLTLVQDFEFAKRASAAQEPYEPDIAAAGRQRQRPRLAAIVWGRGFLGVGSLLIRSATITPRRISRAEVEKETTQFPRIPSWPMADRLELATQQVGSFECSVGLISGQRTFSKVHQQQKLAVVGSASKRRSPTGVWHMKGDRDIPVIFFFGPNDEVTVTLPAGGFDQRHRDRYIEFKSIVEEADRAERGGGAEENWTIASEFKSEAGDARMACGCWS